MIIDLTTLRLQRGAHSSREIGVGVMEAVAWLADEPHTDHPDSASPVIGTYCRLVNDRVGEKERQRLVEYVPRLVGTRSTHEVELRRATVIADWAVRTVAAEALRTAGLLRQAEHLEALAPVSDAGSAREAAQAAAAAGEAALRASASTSGTARAAARKSWFARTPERVKRAEEARGAAVIVETARTAVAEAAEAAAEVGAAWTAAAQTEAAVHAAASVEAAMSAWASAVHAAVQVPTAPVDWTTPLEGMLDVAPAAPVAPL